MFRIVPLALGMVLVIGCASLTNGSQDTVRIITQPPGADFTTNTGHIGKTPSSITIPDDVTLEATFTLDGYHEQKVLLPPKGSGSLFGNILLGGVGGAIIDIGSGNYLTHDDELMVILTPIDQPKPEVLDLGPPEGMTPEEINKARAAARAEKKKTASGSGGNATTPDPDATAQG